MKYKQFSIFIAAI